MGLQRGIRNAYRQRRVAIARRPCDILQQAKAICRRNRWPRPWEIGSGRLRSPFRSPAPQPPRLGLTDDGQKHAVKVNSGCSPRPVVAADRPRSRSHSPRRPDWHSKSRASRTAAFDRRLYSSLKTRGVRYCSWRLSRRDATRVKTTIKEANGRRDFKQLTWRSRLMKDDGGGGSEVDRPHRRRRNGPVPYRAWSRRYVAQSALIKSDG